jgi:PPOX class probable F420-dependent enzyme
MELETAIDFARTNQQSVLATIRANGRPQLSSVLHSIDCDGRFRISITADRAKYRNLRRTPWAALHISRDDFFAYVVVEGDVELSPVVKREDDPVVEELLDHYRALRGPDLDWDVYRAAQVSERRVLVRLQPDRAYGMLQMPPAPEEKV